MEFAKLIKLFPNIYKETERKIIYSYDYSQYLDVIKKYDQEPLKTSKTIPKILHFIWLGISPLPEQSRKNFSYYAKTIKKFGGDAVLWIDQVNTDPGFHHWLKESSILLMNVESFFYGNESMSTFCYFKAALAKIPSNFGEASDLLRYEIIDRFGGYYFDHDVKEGDVDLRSLLFKGKNPFGFVCGRWPTGHFRNDLFGALPQTLLIKNIKELILKNYNKNGWKSYVEYKRELLNDFTVFTTGPEVFNEGIKQLLSNENPSDKRKREICNTISVKSTVGISAKSWIHQRHDPKSIQFPNDQEVISRVKHDLMLHLIYEEKILDLDKYQFFSISKDQDWLISLVEDILKEHPALLKCVDRIFVENINHYLKLKEILENEFKKEICWNELAALRFACVMKKNSLIRHLLDDKAINPFDRSFADVGYYDCSHAQPFAILLETGNIEIVEKVLSSSGVQDVRDSFIPQETGLIYAGPHLASHMSSCSIPKFKIEQLTRQKQYCPKNSHQHNELELKINSLKNIQQLIDPFMKNSK